MPASSAPICPDDPHSFASTKDFAIVDSILSLDTNFETKILAGKVTHSLRALDPTATTLVLDSSYLEIHSVTLNGAPVPYTIADRHPSYGSPILITLPVPHPASLSLSLSYSTTSKCTALQWLAPSQTLGKTHPYLFTQCQSIHARSLLPCFDTPANKSTFSRVELVVPENLRGLFGGIPVDEEVVSGGKRVCVYEQKIAIPSYLVAFAVGDLEGRDVGPRTRVWCEREMVEKAAWEFADTEAFIKVAEDMLTPYVWGRYDLLVLPASFPYGGMENPCLTFVTPSLIAGDRSLVDVIAHELAHSWSGNLVTSRNWEHFWLNEGFTMFIERKILGRVHGEGERQFSAIVGVKALKESCKHYEEIGTPEYTALVPKLDGIDPDDAYSSVPYEKGFTFLYYLEQLLGGPAVFEPWLKSYIETFSHKSITTEEFKQHLIGYFAVVPEKAALLEKVDWNLWLNGHGMPPAQEYDQTLANACSNLAEEWEQYRSTPDQVNINRESFEKLTTMQKVVFLERLMEKPAYSAEFLDRLDYEYGLTAIQNAEIKHRWQMVCLQGGYEKIFPAVEQFVTTMGRMKYTRPLYRGLVKSGDRGTQLAQRVFRSHVTFYHPIAAAMIAKDIGVTL
ncbi:peptidase family M1-domain-containing protein [Cladochytrium replicatum]|nr:peptidase family M1-domain-containing protein [Cladochytrium replicatum]